MVLIILVVLVLISFCRIIWIDFWIRFMLLLVRNVFSNLDSVEVGRVDWDNVIGGFFFSVCLVVYIEDFVDGV